MKMKADVEIVTGFIGAGKTAFINALIEETLIDSEKIVVIQCEMGERQLKESIKKDSRITIKLQDPEKPLTVEYLKYILNIHSPHRVIIEANGTRVVSELLDVINKKEIAHLCKLTTLFHITEAVTFNLFINNMSNFLLPSIQLSNLIVINNTNSLKKEELEDIRDNINILNQHAQIIEVQEINSMETTIKKSNVLDNGILKKCRTYIKNFLYK